MDTKEIQSRLSGLGYKVDVDGVLGRKTKAVIALFQKNSGLLMDGIAGPKTKAALLEPVDINCFHGYGEGSVRWRLNEDGYVETEREGVKFSSGKPKTVKNIISRYEYFILECSQRYSVPMNLIVACIATESRGKHTALRIEPGWYSDIETPNRVSAGLMQTLISTARHTLSKSDIDREWLFEAENSIIAGTSYIADQSSLTGYDPPKVACAYNAGGLYINSNEWGMRQWPIGTGRHAWRFVKFFNDSNMVILNA